MLPFHRLKLAVYRSSGVMAAPLPPDNPSGRRRPVASASAQTADGYTVPPQNNPVNPYGLSSEALVQKEKYDRERAKTNSAVRAVRAAELSLCWGV